MKRKKYMTRRKRVAWILLAVFCLNLLTPSLSYALTSGPTQPEAKGFQPAGVTDMVDLETGDFKYNIPLLDIDGYPINLNYQSGTGMEDEASWVGLGWNLNVGSINRQMRGVPDDMNGDVTEADHYTRPKVTVGGRVSVKGELGGSYIPIKGEGSFSLGVFNDNYTGIGAEIGVNAGISVSTGNDGGMTAGLGAGVLSNTSSGVDLTPYINLGLKSKADYNTTVSAGLSASLGYNTRSGMKSLSLGSSFGVAAQKDFVNVSVTGFDVGDISVSISSKSGSANYSLGGSTISYNTEPVNPRLQIPYTTTYDSFSIDVGFAGATAFAGAGGSGYKRVQEVQKVNKNPTYGFLYAQNGKNKKDALMDFIREKDNPVIPELPNLALPVQTPDLFTFTSQAGSGQFRLYRGGSGIFFDNEVTDVSNSSSLGFDLGFGAYFHGGTTIFQQHATNTTRKWVDKNNYLGKGDFQDASYSNPQAQNVYFKIVGEKTQEDADMVNQLQGTDPVALQLQRPIPGNKDVYVSGGSTFAINKLSKQTRDPQRTSVSYLTASEAQWGGLDKMINNYPVNDVATFTPPANHKPKPYTQIPRVSDYRKAHHFSEMTVTDEQGKRMVYGLPVYSISQAEYTFAVGSRTATVPDYSLVSGKPSLVQFAAGQLETSLGVNKGIDSYYHKDLQPAYASSFLLTGILSPDYVDKTGNGITDDDLGTGIKFNYSMPMNPPVSPNPPTPKTYKWRTPYNNATLNKGLPADPKDDKGSIVFGEKELWYISSIESKTKIVYFITANRTDGTGVTTFSGGVNTANPQKRLEEIRLYSKADMTRPIKVVKFNYDYSLCPGTPNSTPGGKLTLTKLYFQYGNTTKGQYFPYKFTYNTTVNSTAVSYTPMGTDRWGVYKKATDNTTFAALANDEFPYTAQEAEGATSAITTNAGQAASLWHLKHIDLPTGGGIDVNYESDDYAYVQDEKAMVMVKVEDLINSSGAVLNQYPTGTNLLGATGFKIKIAATTVTGEATDWFKRTYLNGSDYIYSKFSVMESTTNSKSEGQDYDFIPCYGQVSSVTVTGGYAFVQLQNRTDGGVTANPIIFSGWQRMKEEYPRYAYPGFDTRVGNETLGQSAASAVQAIFHAFANLSEFSENFYKKAQRKPYCSNVQLNKSFVKIVKNDGHKLGGGVRVKSIVINDDWLNMTGNTIKSYGQSYNYTTVEDGQVISSGVATYEPAVGNDENPLKQPVPYEQKIKGAIDNFFDLEEPFGESFFPAPSVGYSKVTVTDLDPNLALQTGYNVNEFYTAKDFPVRISETPMQRFNNPSYKYGFTETSSVDELILSQGYSIELNDMHGKPKAIRTFNQAGAEVSSTVYYYNATRAGGGQMRLDNHVNIVNQDGTVSQNQVIGRNIEFFTDFREQESINNGQTLNLGADIVPAFGFPLPIPHWPTGDNSEYKLFRSACGVKVIQNYGIIDKVVKTQNGSSITTENIAYDGSTGDPIVTRTQNEFNKDIFSVNIPAYWAYPGMGPSSQNLGVILAGLATSATGSLSNDYGASLRGGDEFIDVGSGNHYWIVDELIDNSTHQPAYEPGTGGYIITFPGGYFHTKFVIDQYGRMQTSLNIPYVKVVRSGSRNLLADGLTSIVCLTNPIINNGASGLKLALDNTDLTGYKVINASSKNYDERWSSEAPDVHAIAGSPPYDLTVHTGTMAVAIAPNVYIDGTAVTGGSAGYYGGRGAACIIGDNSLSRIYTVANSNTMGVFATFYVPHSGTYFVGYGSQAGLSFSFDSNSGKNCNRDNWIVHNTYDAAGTRSWKMIPVTLDQGIRTIRIELTFVGANNGTGYNAGGIEIYDNSASSLTAIGAAGTGAGLNVVFSTRSLINNPQNIVYATTPGGVSYYQNYFTDGLNTPFSPCSVPNYAINPYMYGFLGNWRPYLNRVFQQNRVYNNIMTVGNNVVDVKNAGYLNNFFSDWYAPPNGASNNLWVQKTSGSSWVTANTINLYDKYGQEIENKDALGRFSSAMYDFNGELPAAVVSNAQNREIYANSLEDVNFAPGTLNYTDPSPVREFKQPSSGLGIGSFATKTYSHTGNYSALLPSDGLQLATIIYAGQQKTSSYLAFDSNNQFIKDVNNPGLYPNGFEPASGPNKSYIFDVWVKDGFASDKSVKIALTSNGTAVPLVCKALVEDWKLLEGTIDLTTAVSDKTALNLLMTPVSGATVYVDDIRIHPYDSQMKSYAYDEATMRLMAELDENAFATFYEYDSEGLLIRVKKETERGIMTLKESRSSQKKRTTP